ncbi:hypothetical protein [Allosphingosinicella vermicomposti]|uniref:hypothetical protein n=1 Tax=Allosphingosinicella vermicomposti TaxID=614671 RepID=UPI00131A4F8F|nr:hypothetical protein [Allosphingosinicella vermicomposti]
MFCDRFVVESSRRVVGVAVKVPGGFKFFSSDPGFDALEAKTFPRARTLISRVADFGRRRREKKAEAALPTLN